VISILTAHAADSHLSLSEKDMVSILYISATDVSYRKRGKREIETDRPRACTQRIQTISFLQVKVDYCPIYVCYAVEGNLGGY
jgi:hypothetical protein